MPITLTSTDIIVSSDASATQTHTYTTTRTITPNPLTTVFEPPSYCTQSYLSNCQTDAVSGTLPCYVSLYPEGVCDSSGQSCYPAVPGALANTYLYSPGLACPTGWTTAWQEVRTPSGEDEETTAHCCPSGLSVTTYGIYSTWCEGTVTQGEQTMIVNGLSECPSSTTAFAFGPNTAVDLTWINVDSTKVSVAGEAVFTVSAEQVALLHKSSDWTAAGVSTTAPSASASSAGSSISSTGSSAGSSGMSGQGSGLSTGAVAGIAVAAAVLGIALVLGAFFLCLRRRHGKHATRSRGGQDAAGRSCEQSSEARTVSGDPVFQDHEAISGVSTSPQTQYELKATKSKSSRHSPSTIAQPLETSQIVELQGSTPTSEQTWSGLRPQSNAETLHHSPQAESGLGGIHEVSAAGHDYQQLSSSPARNYMDDSRQNTPIDMVRRGAGGRGF